MRHEKLRRSVCNANALLADTGLVRWTSGNVSARDFETGDIVIKPSGILFHELTPEMMVILDPQGNVIEGELKPSVDSKSHLHVYRNMPSIGGIAHTHSRYATAFAVAGMALPVSTTTHACLFGHAIPCTGLAAIGEEEIGREIVENIGGGSAVLLRNHGVFTVGKDAQDAVKYAVYAEESAEASYHCLALRRDIPELGEDFIEESRRMYLEDYGQTDKIND